MNLTRNMLAIGLFAAALLFSGTALAASSEVDVLVDVLVKKGILSPEEARQILNETKKIVAEQKEEVTKEVGTAKLPGWAEKLDFKGDVRLRYQFEDLEEGKKDRYRERLRFRWGGTAQVLDNLELGFGLATGSSDPRSTNQTFQDTFSTKAINLDKAYFDYSPVKNLNIVGGKFNKAFFTTDDLLFDTDITFEGQSLKYHTHSEGPFNFFFNTGLFIMDEISGSGADPFMYYAQPGFAVKGDNYKLEMGLGYWGFSHVKGATLEHSSGTNTIEGDGLKYDYNSINPVVKYTYNWESHAGVDYAFSLIGDYIHNSDSDDSGFLFGFKIGSPKVTARNDWQIYLNMRDLERDAWLDVFPDSDCRGGATGFDGYEFIFTYGLAKNVSADLDYYHTEMSEGESKDNDMFQINLVFKF